MKTMQIPVSYCLTKYVIKKGAYLLKRHEAKLCFVYLCIFILFVLVKKYVKANGACYFTKCVTNVKKPTRLFLVLCRDGFYFWNPCF